MWREFEHVLSDAAARVAQTQAALRSLGIEATAAAVEQVPAPKMRGLEEITQSDVFQALDAISSSLGSSYAQVKRDLADPGRGSWAGTAHEIREILATLLRTKAPDADVKQRPWFKQEAGTSGPTQKQRVRYILEQAGAGSKERELADELSALDEMVGSVVRAMYGRASDAAHRFKGRREVIRLVRYFDAFARDLLDLE